MGTRLADRVAIVTGAARGIGKAYCLGLAREGASVVAADVLDCSSTIAEIEKLGGRAVAASVDVSLESDAKRMAELALAQFGRIDILINNAALSPEEPLDALTFSQWRRVLSVNLDGVFLCSQAVIPAMKSSGYGRIINIASSTVSICFPDLVHYITAKAGVMGMTRAMSVELGEFGITVNSISPGLTLTERTSVVPEETWGMQVAMQSIKRKEMPEDLVGAAVFLASDDAAFITGQMFSVCGGFVKY